MVPNLSQVTLYDGTCLISWESFEKLRHELDLTRHELERKGVFPIHPSFRIVATGDLPSAANPYITEEVMSLFHFHYLPALNSKEKEKFISSVLAAHDNHHQHQHSCRQVDNNKGAAFVHSLVCFSNLLDANKQLQIELSTRQLLRAAKRISYYPEDAYQAMQNICLSCFLPATTREAINTLIAKSGVRPTTKVSKQQQLLNISESLLQENSTSDHSLLSVHHLVPEVDFCAIPSHTYLLREMWKDYQLGEHLLLIGIQGVGKNKLADRFLQQLQLPRQYIQLHRDTTVSSLTLQPSLNNGTIVWTDSPLVTAVKEGHILVIDEADKGSLLRYPFSSYVFCSYSLRN